MKHGVLHAVRKFTDTFPIVALNRWTIQSLKPNKKGSSGPEFCDGAESYKSDSVKTFVEEMKTEWTDVHTADNKGNGFWGYQWKKHGACTKHMSQTEYFSRGKGKR